MGFGSHLKEFAGLPVLDFPVRGKGSATPVEPDGVAWRLSADASEQRLRAFHVDWDADLDAMLETLDLSLGTLGDEGAASLLAGQPLTHLAKLDLHHHFMSDAMMQRLRAALPGVDLDLSEQEEPEEWDDDEPPMRYIAVSE
nr:hypothetical protein [Actinospica robiniae]